MRQRAAWVIVGLGALSACAPTPSAPIPPGAGPEWQALGFSAQEGEAYAKLGMSPLSAQDLNAAGISPGDLQQWEAISPSSSGGAFGDDAPVDTFLAAKRAGLYPSDLAPLADAGLPLTDPKVVLNAVDLMRAGYSAQQAADYAENGVTRSGVAAYRRQKAKAQADAQAAAARKAAVSAALAVKCPGGVESGNVIFQMSPFAIEGKCYRLTPLPVGQWESATEALILVMGTPIDIETDVPMTGQMTPSGLYVGEAPLQYQAVSGEASTAYKLHYIGPAPQ